jgi:hypothetical protein
LPAEMLVILPRRGAEIFRASGQNRDAAAEQFRVTAWASE